MGSELGKNTSAVHSTSITVRTVPSLVRENTLYSVDSSVESSACSVFAVYHQSDAVVVNHVDVLL